jgi:hypothetical protein
VNCDLLNSTNTIVIKLGMCNVNVLCHYVNTRDLLLIVIFQLH